MKAILEFNLPEDSDAHRAAVNAEAIISAVYEYDRELRNSAKYLGNKTIFIEDARTILHDRLGPDLSFVLGE